MCQSLNLKKVLLIFFCLLTGVRSCLLRNQLQITFGDPSHQSYLMILAFVLRISLSMPLYQFLDSFNHLLWSTLPLMERFSRDTNTLNIFIIWLTVDLATFKWPAGLLKNLQWLGKTWNFDQKLLKKPGTFNNFNMFKSKISIWHKKYII